MKLSKRDSILLGVLALALLVGGTWWFVVKPANKDAAATRDQVEQVEGQISIVRDTLDRLERDSKGESARTAERLRLAKAIPQSAAVPGTIVQLQRLAKRSNVELAGVKTISRSGFGALAGIQLEVRVDGRFFDVDDFLFRMHRMVNVNRRDKPVVKGRLLAVTAVNIDLAEEVNPNAAGSQLGPEDRVQAVLTVVAFSEGDGTGGDPTAPAATSAASAPPAGEPPADDADDGGSEPQTGGETQ
ncbi:MAG: type II secretion system protein GspM [Miltoncostaeaceae bacterium]